MQVRPSIIALFSRSQAWDLQGQRRAPDGTPMVLSDCSEDNPQTTSSTKARYRPPTREYRHLAHTVLHQQDPLIYDVPSLQVPHFIERKAWIKRLEEEATNDGSRTTVVTLLAMGGAGKSQLALEWCRRQRNGSKVRYVFWVDASTLQGLRNAMGSIAERLGPDRQFSDSEASTRFVLHALSGSSYPWLMVFDNLDEPSVLACIDQFIPNSRHGVILVTSRLDGARELGVTLEIGVMDGEEGRELLLGSQPINWDNITIERILQRLGHLPLAIDQVRAYIQKRKLSLEGFMKEFEERKQKIMQETPTSWRYHRPDVAGGERQALNLMTTWEMTLSILRSIRKEPRVLEDTLTVLAFFHPFRISERIFKSSSTISSSSFAHFCTQGHWNHSEFRDAIVQLQELSLVQFSDGGDNDGIVVALHSMISDWLRERQEVDSRNSFLACAVQIFRGYLTSISESNPDYEQRVEILSHMDTICKFLDLDGLNSEFLQACNWFGRFYQENGHFSEAEEMWNRALAGREKILGPDHPDTLMTVHSLGVLYYEQRCLDEAEKMYDRALAGREKILGPDHPDTLMTVNNLNVLYYEQRRLDEAEKMCNRALVGREKILGPDHPHTLMTVHNLSMLYQGQGHLKNAETMYNRALAGREKILGPDHPHTLMTVDNLGSLYYKQCRLDEAEKMYDRALAGCKKILGPDHPHTLNTVYNLGNLYDEQCCLDKAEKMYDQALAGYEKILGPDHPHTLLTVHNLGYLYDKQHRLDEAEKMYDQALAGRKKILGPNHPDTLMTIRNLRSLRAVKDTRRLWK
jgi:tetratricopeptide (TPR) repeat protein